MTNAEIYKCYARAQSKIPVFIEGKRFLELLFLRNYDREMFDGIIEGKIFYVPKYSIEKAIEDIGQMKKSYVTKTLEEVEKLKYKIFEDDTPQTIYEDVRLVMSAKALRKRFPRLQLDVSNEVMENYRIAVIQEKIDSDLI